MIALWIVLGVVVLLLIYGVVAYNRFVAQRNVIRNAFADIDTELKRRYDLIPNLVETVKGYATHERELFEEVARARAGAIQATGPAQQAQAENVLSAALGRLFAVAEQYPQLRATENFQQLQAELTNTEDRIQNRRGFYNDTVRQYNERVQSVPSNVIASMFNFNEEEFFEVEPSTRPTLEEAPRVDFGTGEPGPATPPPAS
ncbi:MAG TPA: LemA family protein [Actinomycetota bacterium]|nr:LemA family protein [Actinomycetota bacterium]